VGASRPTPAKHGRAPVAEAKQQWFPVTDWAAVLQAGRSDFAVSGGVQDGMLRVYLPALQRFLLRVRRLSPDHVEDILQGFVAEKVLRGGLFRRADRTRGRFRNLLLKSLNNYVATWYERRGRDPVTQTADGTLPETPVAAEQVERFDEEWGRQTVTSALEMMKAECEEKSRSDVWAVFHGRVVRPAYYDDAEVPYEELVRDLGLSSPRDAINLLLTGKRMLLRCLRQAVGRYLPDGAGIDEELADLRGILMRSRNRGDGCW